MEDLFEFLQTMNITNDNSTPSKSLISVDDTNEPPRIFSIGSCDNNENSTLKLPELTQNRSSTFQLVFSIFLC